MVGDEKKIKCKYLILLRPQQWVKNVFVFAALLFSLDNSQVNGLNALYACISFIAISAAGYILNDIVDRERDKLHPTKKYRPIATGSISVANALFLYALLVVFSLSFAYCLDFRFFILVAAYLIIQVGYSFFFKNIVLLDVFCIALGFFIRLLSGAIVIGVSISLWFYLTAVAVSLFMSFCKRKYEFIQLKLNAKKHRPVLSLYSELFLDRLISLTGILTAVFYALYTIAPETIMKHHTTMLILTIPLVVLGMYRYRVLIVQNCLCEKTEERILWDTLLQIIIFIYVLLIGMILYGK